MQMSQYVNGSKKFSLDNGNNLHFSSSVTHSREGMWCLFIWCTLYLPVENVQAELI